MTKVVFILGSGYSGTTLLDLILGSHSRMIGLGEIHAKAFDPFLNENQLCTCLFRARECHFWSKVLTRLRDLTGQESFRLAPVDVHQHAIVRNTADLFRAIQEVSGAEVLVDSSKRTRRANLLVESGLFEPKIIHLVRDGRGVAYSYLKRGQMFRQAVAQWVETNTTIRDWLEHRKEVGSLRLRYEDFCAQPIESTRRICDFLGVEWEPEMMRFGEKTHHNVKGNPMRFDIGESSVKLDETWKDRLEIEHLSVFEELAGPLARQLGYSHALPATAPVLEGGKVSSGGATYLPQGDTLVPGY
jgi:hypothetical protein